EEVPPGCGEGPAVGHRRVGVVDVLVQPPAGDAGCQVAGGQRPAHVSEKAVDVPRTEPVHVVGAAERQRKLVVEWLEPPCGFWRAAVAVVNGPVTSLLLDVV